MKAVILVGGEGTRLRPLTCNIPKTMVPVLNKPFLERMIQNIRPYGITEVILAMGYLPDRIQDYFGDGVNLGVTITYVVESFPLGTAGAVKNLESLLNETFFVFNGDVFMDLNLGKMLTFHRDRKAQATIALVPVENPSAYGVVALDQGGRVQQFIEKPPKGSQPSNLINAGCYILEPGVLKYAPAGAPSMFERDLFPTILREGLPVYGLPSSGYWLDIGNPSNYLQLHHDLLKGGLVQEGACSIDPSASIEGPVLLGKGCVIGAGVRIQGPVAMGDGCRIGEGSRLSGSVLWRHVQVGRGSTLNGCILGDNSFIGDEVTLSEGCVIADEARVLSGNRLERGIAIWPRNIIPPESITFRP